MSGDHNSAFCLLLMKRISSHACPFNCVAFSVRCRGARVPTASVAVAAETPISLAEPQVRAQGKKHFQLLPVCILFWYGKRTAPTVLCRLLFVFLSKRICDQCVHFPCIGGRDQGREIGGEVAAAIDIALVVTREGTFLFCSSKARCWCSSLMARTHRPPHTGRAVPVPGDSSFFA
jgi:hypothetical protein